MPVLLIREVRMVKSPYEIEILRDTAKLHLKMGIGDIQDQGNKIKTPLKM